MNTKNAVVYNSSQRQVIEYVSAVSPNVQRAVLSKTFIIESINLSYLSAFVVASDESDQIGIAHFVCQ